MNPLNGSDAFENPDGDGYDVNRDGVLSQDEAFVNYLEYHIRSDLFNGNQNARWCSNCPGNFTTKLFDHISDLGAPDDTFADRASGSVTAGLSSYSVGAADPLSADTDDDGMPDGWENLVCEMEFTR